jgi:hypothetical protein
MCTETGVAEQGLPEDERPPAVFGDLSGPSGNTFAIMGAASQALKAIGKQDKTKEMVARVTGGEAKSYHHAIRIILEYVSDPYHTLHEELEKGEDLDEE